MTHENHRIDALPHGSMLHTYMVERVLGSGAFGITYLAKHRHLDSWHVIKEYLPDCGVREHNRSTVSPKSASDKDLFDWGLKCFFDEAKLLHQLSHPHVVKVTDLFDANGTAYFVMPYLQGDTLHEWMKNNPRPSQTDLEAIFVPLLEGLKYIHDKGLLHRDIKPENIFITGNGHPVLIDFGSARIAIGQKSKALTQVLTPHFAPFEQYASKGTFTPALDIYSLAACMYQAITGDLPEEAPNRIVDDPQPRLAAGQYTQHYAPHFLQAIDKSLSVYAKDRHQDGFAMQKDLVGWSEFFLKKFSTISIKHQPSAIWSDPITDMEFIYVEPGDFMMGMNECEDEDAYDEIPKHSVRITNGFWLGKYPVTQAQWKKVIDSNPSFFEGSNNPVEMVNWYDAHEFIRKLNILSVHSRFTLPTEAQWEYAARGGNKSLNFLYSGSDNINDVAWYSFNSHETTHPVGKKKSNELGFYDMSGNVAEWVSDWFGYYTKSIQNDPHGPSMGVLRLFRGGAWDSIVESCNVAFRNPYDPSGAAASIGFRLVRVSLQK